MTETARHSFLKVLSKKPCQAKKKACLRPSQNLANSDQNSNMYSESEDFKEKAAAFSDMIASLSQLNKNWALSGCKLALKVGGSGGLLSAIVSNAGPRVICTDIVDIQAKYNGEFQKLLKEKCERNGYKLDLAKIEFHTMDAQDLAYQENRFDLIFSLNAIEHIPSPLIAIKEIWRVLKPGGMFYASFDPIWSADSGSHFMHYTKEPWLHLIVDDNSYCEAMRKAGAAEWETNEYLTAMNRLPVTFYMKDMKAALEKLFSQHTLTSWSGCVSSEFANHKNHIQAARKTGMSPEELLVRGFRIVALK